MSTQIFSKLVGAQIDAYRESAHGWCNECAEGMQLAELKKSAGESEEGAERSNYFVQAIIAFFADCVARRKGEKTEDWKEHAQKEAEEKYKSLSSGMLRNTPLFAYMMSAEKMFNLLCSECVGYYKTNREGKRAFIFASLCTLAINEEKLTTEQKSRFDELCKEEVTDSEGNIIGYSAYCTPSAYINQKGEAVTLYYLYKDAEAVQEYLNKSEEEREADAVLQRRKEHTEAKESARVWINEQGNICTLKARNKFNYKKVLPVVSYFVSAQNEAERKAKKEQEKQEKKMREAEEKRVKRAERLHTFAESMHNILDKIGESALTEAGKKKLNQIKSAGITEMQFFADSAERAQSAREVAKEKEAERKECVKLLSTAKSMLTREQKKSTPDAQKVQELTEKVQEMQERVNNATLQSSQSAEEAQKQERVNTLFVHAQKKFNEECARFAQKMQSTPDEKEQSTPDAEEMQESTPDAEGNKEVA